MSYYYHCTDEVGKNGILSQKTIFSSKVGDHNGVYFTKLSPEIQIDQLALNNYGERFLQYFLINKYTNLIYRSFFMKVVEGKLDYYFKIEIPDQELQRLHGPFLSFLNGPADIYMSSKDINLKDYAWSTGKTQTTWQFFYESKLRHFQQLEAMPHYGLLHPRNTSVTSSCLASEAATVYVKIKKGGRRRRRK